MADEPVIVVRDPKSSVSLPGHIHTAAYLYVETRPPIIRTGKNEYGWAEIWVDGVKNEGAKKKGLPKP